MLLTADNINESKEEIDLAEGTEAKDHYMRSESVVIFMQEL